jgi:hypothetical protein
VRPVMTDDFIAFAVSEADQGQDLDGDGLLAGAVLHVHDARTGQTRNVARNVTSSLHHRAGLVGFTSNERPRGDLNGDGDADDEFVPHFYDPRSQALARVPVTLLRDTLLDSEAWIGVVDEVGQRADLDHDGDLEGGVYHALDPQLGQWTSLRLSSRGPPLSDWIDLGGEGAAALVAAENDGVDRNGNGSLLDTRIVVHDVVQGRSFETGLHTFGDNALGYGVAGTTLALRVSEVAQGEDLDGDGGVTLASVVHLVDLRTGAAKSLAVDTGSELWSSAAGVLFLRGENGRDLNGDGDSMEWTLYRWRTGASAVINTKLTASVLDMQGGHALLWALEADSHLDLNRDGDELDTLLVRYRLADDSIEVLARWSFASLGHTRFGREGIVVHLASELELNQDLNSDGDEVDRVLSLGARPSSGN